MGRSVQFCLKLGGGTGSGKNVLIRDQNRGKRGTRTDEAHADEL
jgi:hypothetical protein